MATESRRVIGGCEADAFESGGGWLAVTAVVLLEEVKWSGVVDAAFNVDAGSGLEFSFCCSATFEDEAGAAAKEEVMGEVCGIETSSRSPCEPALVLWGADGRLLISMSGWAGGVGGDDCFSEVEGGS
jgi:hypothetical protein